MKQYYIITDDFLARLYRLVEMECPNAVERDELAELKPVERMNEGQIFSILMEMNKETVRVPVGWKQFTKAVENHHFGSEE